MEELEVSKQCLTRTISKFSSHKDFPELCCNVASKHLLDILKQEGKEVRMQFSYQEPGDGHTFVVQTLSNGEEVILDPTYAQYEEGYEEGLIAHNFPNTQLEEHRLEPEQFREQQKKWLEQGVYDNL